MDRVKIRCLLIINRLYIASNAIIDAGNVKYLELYQIYQAKDFAGRMKGRGAKWTIIPTLPLYMTY